MNIPAALLDQVVKGPMTHDDAALKLMWLALRSILADKVRSAK